MFVLGNTCHCSGYVLSCHPYHVLHNQGSVLTLSYVMSPNGYVITYYVLLCNILIMYYYVILCNHCLMLHSFWYV